MFVKVRIIVLILIAIGLTILIVFALKLFKNKKNCIRENLKPNDEVKQPRESLDDQDLKNLNRKYSESYAASLFNCFSSIEIFREYFLKQERSGVIGKAITTIIKLIDTSKAKNKHNKVIEQIEIIEKQAGFVGETLFPLVIAVDVFYEFIMTSCILEDNNRSDYLSHFEETDLYTTLDIVNNFLTKKVLYEKRPLDDYFYTRPQIYIEIHYSNKDDIKSQVKDSEKDFDAQFNKNVIVVNILNHIDRTLNVKVPKNVIFFNKTYLLRSFIVNKSITEDNFLFEARLLKEGILYSIDVDGTTKDVFLENSTQGRPVLIFYELDNK